MGMADLSMNKEARYHGAHVPRLVFLIRISNSQTSFQLMQRHCERQRSNPSRRTKEARIASSLALLAMTVIPHACGVSSTPRPFRSITDAPEYWIVRLRGR
jgi:hypothetical protein